MRNHFGFWITIIFVFWSWEPVLYNRFRTGCTDPLPENGLETQRNLWMRRSSIGQGCIISIPVFICWRWFFSYSMWKLSSLSGHCGIEKLGQIRNGDGGFSGNFYFHHYPGSRAGISVGRGDLEWIKKIETKELEEDTLWHIMKGQKVWSFPPKLTGW